MGMTYRQLLAKILETNTDLDTMAMIRIRHRQTPDDPVTHVQIVPIAGFYSVRDHIAVELSDINLSQVVPNIGMS